MEYNIPIKRTKIKKKHMTSMHLVAGFMIIIIAAVILGAPEEKVIQGHSWRYMFSNISMLMGLLIIVATIAFNKSLAKPKYNMFLRLLEILLFGALILFTAINTWWMHTVYAVVGAAAVLTTYLLELSAHKPEYIKINEQGIHLKKWKTKVIDWCDTKNFLIRHGNVTINLRNNTLYQYAAFNFKEIHQKEEIENYALTHINDNAHKYQEDWN